MNNINETIVVLENFRKEWNDKMKENWPTLSYDERLILLTLWKINNSVILALYEIQQNKYHSRFAMLLVQKELSSFIKSNLFDNYVALYEHRGYGIIDQNMRHHIRVIFDVLDMPPEEDEGQTTLERKGQDYFWVRPDGERIPLRGDVRFYGVDFSYEPEKPVLKDLSLYAKPGQKIAFVGSTNLINRFYDIQGGKITYDGIDVRHIRKEDLRRSLGTVLQDTHLFTGTVMENIRYGRLDAMDEDCIRAAKVANAHYFISHLPVGYQTMLYSDGANLSQGQRQLLAIARAAVSQAPVLILDEATSSVDTRTEKLIESGLDRLMQGRTVFVIAHRLSTVRNADAILVLEQGRVVERGNHDDLLSQHGRYYQLYTNMIELA